MARQANRVTVQVTGDKELAALLDRLPKMVVAAGGPTDRAVRKGGNIVARRARQLAPDSSKTRTMDKMTQKSFDKWPHHTKNTIGTKVVLYPNNSVAIIGPKSPEGNAAYFGQEKPRKHVLWGKTVTTYRIVRNWITQAFDETKSEQQSAMAASLRADIDKIVKG